MESVLRLVTNGKYSSQRVFILFLLISILFFLQLPLHQSLPGNWDTWLYLSLFNYYPDYLVGLLKDLNVYQPFFPDNHPSFVFGEPSFFNSIIYIPIQYLIGSPIWSFYIFICIITSLNALGIFQVAKKIYEDKLTAIISGFLLIFSNYMLSSLDQCNVLSVYPSLFSIYYLICFYKTNYRKNIFWASFWGAIQIYCSGYHFLFLFIVILVLILFTIKKSIIKENFIWIVMAVLFLLLLISPYAYIYLFSGLSEIKINPVTESVLKDLSLHLQDFTRSHPYNILYGSNQDESLIFYLHSINPGFILTSLFIMGLFKSKYKIVFVGLIFVFTILSCGPEILGIQNPVYILMKSVGVDQFMRTPIRAFMVILIIACILSAQSLRYIFQNRPFLGICIFIFLMIENVPFKLQYFQSNAYVNPPENLLAVANDMNKDEVLWIQPSTLYALDDIVLPGIGQVNREYIYMYWQTIFKRDMVNGMNGYVPKINAEIRMDTELKDSIILDNQVFRIKYVYLKGMNYNDGK